MEILHPTLRAQVVRSRTTQLTLDRVVIGFAMPITTQMMGNVWNGPLAVVVSSKAAVPLPQPIVGVCHAHLHAQAIRI